MNKIKNFLYGFIKNQLKKQLTGNMGKVVEDDDKIICYVKKNKCSKYNRYSFIIISRILNEQDKKLSKLYNLDKKIVYLIENIDFNKNVRIFGYNDCDFIIRNCKFNGYLTVSINGDCNFNNVSIIGQTLLTIGAKNLTFKNVNLKNKFKYAYDDLPIYIGADDKLNIIDSKIGDAKKSNISLYSGKSINILNSDIKANEVDIKSKNIKSDDNSSILGFNKISIKSSKFKTPKLYKSSIIINEKEIQTSKNEFSLSNPKTNMEIKRLELLSLLNEIKKQCEEKNSNEIESLQKKLYNQPISKNN